MEIRDRLGLLKFDTPATRGSAICAANSAT